MLGFQRKFHAALNMLKASGHETVEFASINRMRGRWPRAIR
jgi:hypothetical protein